METNGFEMVYSIDVKNDKNTIYKKSEMGLEIDDIEGFVVWYLNHPPTEQDMRTSFGFKADYNGLGIYVFKHQGQWRILSIYNQGLEGLTVEAAVANLSKLSLASHLFYFSSTRQLMHAL